MSADMNETDFPPATAATGFPALIALAETFARIVRAETAALRSGERAGFDALTRRKAEYQATMQQSMTALEAQKDRASSQDRERWRAAAADAEAALQENARLIAGEQLHAAAMLDMLRQTLRERSTAGYSRDGKLKPRS